jgi:hypothetical protein
MVQSIFHAGVVTRDHGGDLGVASKTRAKRNPWGSEAERDSMDQVTNH